MFTAVPPIPPATQPQRAKEDLSALSPPQIPMPHLPDVSASIQKSFSAMLVPRPATGIGVSTLKTATRERQPSQKLKLNAGITLSPRGTASYQFSCASRLRLQPPESQDFPFFEDWWSRPLSLLTQYSLLMCNDIAVTGVQVNAHSSQPI